MQSDFKMMLKLVFSVVALLALGACTGDDRPIPFEAIPVDLTYPSVPEGGDSNSEFVEFQLEIFDNLGGWPPDRLDATERVLRSEGRQVEANAVRIFSSLRSNTLDEVCAVSNGGFSPLERYVLLLENLLIYARSDRSLENWVEAIEHAEMLDDTNLWQFHPPSRRCAAFEVSATSSPTIGLKNRAKFWKIHDRNRATLRSAFEIVRRAAEAGLSQDQTPFAFGRSLEFQSTEVQSFLRHFKPVEVVHKIPDMYDGQSIHALEQGGESLIVMEAYPYGKIARYQLGSAAVTQLERPDGFLVSEFSKEVTFARAYVSSCDATNSPCERANLVVEVRSEIGNKIGEFNTSISFNGNRLESLIAKLASLSADQNLAFVWLTGSHARPRTSGPQLTGWPPSMPYSELILIDLIEAKVLLRLNSAELGEFVLSGFVADELYAQRFLLGHIENDRAQPEFRVEEYALSGEPLGEIPIDSKLSGRRFPIGFLENLSRGYDVSRLVASCQVCDVIGQTPDGRYWIVSPRGPGRSSVELWDVETNTREAKISLNRREVNWRSYDIESGRIAVPMGYEHQVYEYINQ